MTDHPENLLYENAFAKSADDWAAEMARDWVMEGRGIATCGEGYLRLRSGNFTVPRDHDGHFNFWLKRDFPANVAFEWEFRYPVEGEEGLALIFWGAQGRGGEDTFAASLPPREGRHMEHYHSGGINCYHTSYIARGRGTANLRKNYGFHHVATGEELSQHDAPNLWHTIRVEQLNARVRLLMNNRVAFDWHDDGSTGGIPVETGGKMSFRQQNNLYYGDYRNFRVYALET